MKKSTFILACLLNWFLNGFGQCSGETGLRIDLSDNSSTGICYTETYSYDENVYTSKYVLSGLDSLLIYTVRVDWRKDGDGSFITIKITDGQSQDCRVKSIAWENDYIASMVKDESFIDTLISKDGNYSMLFTIPERDKQFITLNHFQSCHSPNVYYRLHPVNDYYLQRHIAEARVIWKEIKYRHEDSLRIEQVRENTDKWIQELVYYKDSVIRAIEIKEKNERPVMADIPMSLYFGQVVDSLFSDFDFDETIGAPAEFTVNFRFLFNKDGYLEEDSVVSRLAAGNLDSAWFYSVYYRQISQQLKAIQVEVKKAERSYLRVIPDLDHKADDIANYFQEKRKVIYFNKEKFRDLENDIKTAIGATRAELEKYRTRVVDIPTLYMYTLRVKFLKRQAEWKVQTEKDDIVVTENTMFAEPVTQCLKDRFKNSLYKKSVKTYRVTIYTAFINDKPAKKCALSKN